VRIPRSIAIIGRASLLRTIRHNIRLAIVGLPNMVDCENEDDIVVQNGEEDIEDANYDDIDDDLCPPPYEGTRANKEDNVNIKLPNE